MAKSDNCWGHCEREKRKNKINQLLTSTQQSVDTSTRVLIKRGPVSEETSLSELEEIYALTSAWKKIEDGGVLCVPIEELRMAKPPKPNQNSGQFGFQKANVGKGTKIEDYAVVQTIKDLNEKILDKYNLHCPIYSKVIWLQLGVQDCNQNPESCISQMNIQDRSKIPIQKDLHC